MRENAKVRLCPFHERLEKGAKYAWCACGRSSKQPFCDGSHKGTKHKPVAFTHEGTTRAVSLCACKQTKTPPYCDGSHRAMISKDANAAMEDRFPTGAAVRDELTAQCEIRRSVPDLPVRDAPAAIRYYAEVLGFDKEFDDAIVGFDHTMFAGMSRGACHVTLDEHRANEAHESVSICCSVTDVDALHAELEARGANIVQPLTNRLWGERDFAVEDLNGHTLRFTMTLDAKPTD